MRIECGSTRERKVRSTLLFVFVAACGLWFAFDGWIKYPKENLEGFRKELPVEERDQVADVRPYPSVTPDTLDAAREAVKGSGAAQALEKLYGGPPTHKNADGWYYFGPAYMVRIPLKNGLPTRPVTESKAAHSETDFFFQRTVAVMLAGISLGCLWQLNRAFRTRLELSEDGLKHKGRGPIPWNSMKSLDSSRFDKKGWVDLHYDDGQERTVRLDEYHISAFDEVMAEICNRKGFANPIRRAGAESRSDGTDGDVAEEDAGHASSREQQDN